MFENSGLSSDMDMSKEGILNTFIINELDINFSEHIFRVESQNETQELACKLNVNVNNIKWKKRTFIRNLLHNPFKNYTFETYYPNEISSSEATITITDFENGIMRFKPESFNYYSSYYSPISHFFSDVLPIILYIGPKYKKY